MNGMVEAATGFAADAHGNGVAYVRVMVGGTPRVLRVAFAVKRFPALLDREVGYAALSAVAAVLRKRGIDRVRFAVDDAPLARDLREHREVPAPLALAYVRLRCALNQLKEYDITASPPGESDLSARARSEAAMHVAA
jgi:hypothetical protein